MDSWTARTRAGSAPPSWPAMKCMAAVSCAAVERIAGARAKARAHVWELIEGTAAGFPWLVIAGKTLTGWLVIDLDATLVTAHSDKEGAAPTWKKGYGFHPLGAWLANTRECLAMLLRPGNAGSNTFTDHKEVLVAEIRHLMSRAGHWPDGLRWIARRVKPSRRHLRNLTGYEKKTGWKYSITCTNIPDDGIAGVPGSHHPQYIDVVHREHAVVETDGVRTAKSMGLRNLPSKTWQVNCGWVLAANIAADLAAWNRLLGFHDCADLKEAEPDTLRYRVWHLPARLVHLARQRILKISPDWPWKQAFLTCWQRLCALPAPT